MIIDYYLTTEHAASSYGVPVLVRRSTNQAFGPADLIQTGNEGVFARIEGPVTAAQHVAFLIEKKAFFDDAEQADLARRFLHLMEG